MLTRDLAGGLATIFIGTAYLFLSFGLRTSSLSDSLGPAGFPKMLGVFMIVLGVILSLQSLIKTLKAGWTGTEWQGQARVVLRAAGLLGFGVAYLLVVQTLGYALSIMLLLFTVSLYQGTRLDWRVAVVAAGGAFMLWAIFVLVLGVSMPSGIFSLDGRG